MSGCFNLTEIRNGCYRAAFHKCGLRPTLTQLKDNATVIHCWAPQHPDPARPNLLLVHGLGANALWQWGDVIPHFVAVYNVYVPDLLFFGESRTDRPDRSERFQAECMAEALESRCGVGTVEAAVGLSYGGFVVYAMAAGLGKGRVGRVVVCGAGVALEERDIKSGLMAVSDLEEAARILVPLTPPRLKQLVGYTFYRPPPMSLIPPCFLNDFIHAMCTDYVEEKKELIRAIPKDRKLSALPKISQPTLIIWGEHDQVFPLELAYRLKRHLGDTAHLAVIKNAGHAFNAEKPKEYLMLLKSFLIDFRLPPECPKLSFEYRDGNLTQANDNSNSTS